MNIKIVSLILGIVILAGCSQMQAVKKKSNTKKYVPVKLEEAPPAVKQDENVVHIGDAPLEFKKTNQEQISDFQKHMLYRDYKIVK